MTIGSLETDPQNSRRKKMNFKRGRSITKWYRADSIIDAMLLANKTKYSKVNIINTISYDEYIKGVEKHHEY